MLDTARVLSLQKQGLMQAVAVDNPSGDPALAVYALSQARFDPDTGERLEDSVTGITLADLQQQRDTLQALLDQCDALLDLLHGLKPTPIDNLGADIQTAFADALGGSHE